MSEEKKGLFSRFKKKQKKQPVTFDQSTITFELRGEPVNTSLIQALVTVKQGKDKGMPLPLNCEWFRSNQQGQFLPIQGVSGSFYQVTADDIGCKVCVHAVPVSEVSEYTGMPGFCQIGPIRLSQDFKQSLTQLLEAPENRFKVWINQIQQQLLLNSDSILIGQSEVKIENGYPQVAISQVSNDSFSLVLQNREIIVRCEQSKRDLVVVYIRTLCGRKLMRSQTDAFLSIQNLSQRLQRINKENQNLKSAFSAQEQTLDMKNRAIAQITKKLENSTKQNLNQIEKLNFLMSKQEEYQQQIKFLKQDIAVYKIQCDNFQSQNKTHQLKSIGDTLKIRNFHQKLVSITQNMHCSNCRTIKDKLMTLIQKLNQQEFEDISAATSSAHSVPVQQELNDNTVELQLEKIKKLKEKLIFAKSKIEEINLKAMDSINRAEAEKNFYKRKTESLAVENDRLLSKLGKNPKEISDFQKEKQEFFQTKSQFFTRIQQAESKADNFQKVMKTYMAKLQQQKKRNFQLTKRLGKKKALGNSDYERIINELTSQITDNEQEIQAQKEIIRQLASRLNEHNQKWVYYLVNLGVKTSSIKINLQ